jgi:hypothetical protein
MQTTKPNLYLQPMAYRDFWPIVPQRFTTHYCFGWVLRRPQLKPVLKQIKTGLKTLDLSEKAEMGPLYFVMRTRGHLRGGIYNSNSLLSLPHCQI